MSKNEDWKNEMYVNATETFFHETGFTEETVNRWVDLYEENCKEFDEEVDPQQASLVIILMKLAIGMERLEKRNDKLEDANRLLSKKVFELNERTEPPKSHS